MPAENAPNAKSPQRPKKLLLGALLGGLGGMVVGMVGGGLLEAAFTGDTYAGTRIGGLVGGLFGAQLGAGNGLFGVGLMLLMIVCSAAGAIAGFIISRPDPASFWSLVPGWIGGISGAFVGLFLAAALARRSRERRSSAAAE